MRQRVGLDLVELGAPHPRLARRRHAVVRPELQHPHEIWLLSLSATKSFGTGRGPFALASAAAC